MLPAAPVGPAQAQMRQCGSSSDENASTYSRVSPKLQQGVCAAGTAEV
jgi:hypothetical protein